jgi:hypothetical protein
MRIGGFALVGLAIVAALVGLLTLTTGGDGTTDQALAPASSTTESAAPVAPADPAAPAAPAPAAPAPAAPAPAAPPVAPTTAPPSEEPIAPYVPGAGASGSTVKAPLRVYNNSRIKGLADEAAADFRGAGWQVDSVGNYSEGVIPTSTVYYRPGDEAAAEALANEFGMRANPGFEGLRFGADGLIVIVTREYGN